jgi:uncharacterized protein (TIGR00297 family)
VRYATNLGHATLAALFAGGVALAGWRAGSLSPSGATAAAAVGAATLAGGDLAAAAALLAFFVSGSALSRRERVVSEVRGAKGGRRDALQVLANGGVAALGALAASAGRERGRGAIVGALAAAAADTWASEIGVRAARPPISIRTGRPLLPGQSGGVTPLGWAAAAAGALGIGVVHALTSRVGESGDKGRQIGVALVAGLIGSLADSLAGATLQASYRCAACGTPSEAPWHSCGQLADLERGRPRVTNDAVNLLATTVGGGIGALTWAA